MKGLKDNDTLLLVSIINDDTINACSVYAYSLSMDGGPNPEDGRTLYRQTIFEEVPYSEIEEIVTLPVTVESLWASADFNNGWIDEGITGLVDASEAVREVNLETGSQYRIV